MAKLSHTSVTQIAFFSEESLPREWENELSREIIPQLRGRRGRKPLQLLMRLMVQRVPLGEQGILPSDAAIFTWGSVSPEGGASG